MKRVKQTALDKIQQALELLQGEQPVNAIKDKLRQLYGADIPTMSSVSALLVYGANKNLWQRVSKGVYTPKPQRAPELAAVEPDPVRSSEYDPNVRNGLPAAPINPYNK